MEIEKEMFGNEQGSSKSLVNPADSHTTTCCGTDSLYPTPNVTAEVREDDVALPREATCGLIRRAKPAHFWESLFLAAGNYAAAAWRNAASDVGCLDRRKIMHVASSISQQQSYYSNNYQRQRSWLRNGDVGDPKTDAD